MCAGGIRGRLHFKHKTTYFLIYSSLGTGNKLVNNTDPYWIFLIPPTSWSWFSYVQPFIFNDKEEKKRKECAKGPEFQGLEADNTAQSILELQLKPQGWKNQTGLIFSWSMDSGSQKDLKVSCPISVHLSPSSSWSQKYFLWLYECNTNYCLWLLIMIL